jgi:CSLREA domain-containing protein
VIALRIRYNVRLLLVLAVTAGAATRVAAATFTVASTADDHDAHPGDGTCATAGGACTLRAAVEEANDPSVTPDTIVLPAGLYPLSIADSMQIRDAITIVGAGADTTVIDAGGITTVLHVETPRPGSTAWSLVLSGVTLRNGHGPNTIGGGIFAEGPLTLVDSVVRDCSAFSGGGVYTTAEATIRRCTFTGNSATALGGGINGYDVTLLDSTVSDNQAGFGGGVFGIGELVIERSTIVDNTASGNGGGVEFQGESARITNCTLSGNGAGQYGGGVERAGVHEAGGDYTPVGSVLLQNSTVTGNHADTDNDGVGNGGGVSSPNAGIRLSNTILAENVDNGGEAPDCAGPIGSLGHDLVEDVAGCTLGGAMTGDLLGVSPDLGPLADNGGPTETRAPLSTSPAIDAGSPTISGTDDDACAASDQRGILRPQPARCDIGAFEIGTDVCSAPLTGCKAAGPHQSKVSLKHSGGPSDRLTWKWRGAATDATDLGDPTTGAGYVLCVFDTSGASPRSLLRSVVPGGTCPGRRPCWRNAGSSLKYQNRLGTPGGVVTLQAKPGPDGQAAVTMKGGGAALELPALPLPASTVVLLQLRSVDPGACWEARYSTHTADTAAKFSATSE